MTGHFRPIRTTIIAAVLGLSVIAPMSAMAEIVRHDTEYERQRVIPGERITRTASCRSGELTGGGYRLSGAEADASFIVLANYPLADGRWRVDIRNQSDAAQPLTLWVYALCLTE